MPRYDIDAPARSAWAGSFSFKGQDKTTAEDITGRTWEFVIRPSAADTSPTAAISVTTVNSSQGVLSVDVPTATVLVSLTASAVALMGAGAAWSYALWMDPDLTTATARVDGTFTATPVAAP